MSTFAAGLGLSDQEQALLAPLFADGGFRGPAINMPDLRRRQRAGGLTQEQNDLFLDIFSRTGPPLPNDFVTGVPDGGFRFGQNLRGAQGFDADRLNSIFGDALGSGFRGVVGRGIQRPDLIRLMQSGYVTGDNLAYLQQLAGIAAPAPPGGGGGGSGSGGGGLGGGHGAAGPPGPFTSGGHQIPPPFQSPQSGQIDNLFTEFLNGNFREPRDIDFLDPKIKGQITEALTGLLDMDREVLPEGDIANLRSHIESLMAGEGYDPDVLQAARNRVRENLEVRERNEIMRRGDQFGGRNFFGSGPHQGSIRDIERATGQALANEFTDIELANLGASERARQAGLTGGLGLGQLLLGEDAALRGGVQQGVGGLLGLGQLNQGEESLAIQEALGYSNLDLDSLRLAISRELGLGNLDLGQMELELQRQLQELIQNLYIQGNLFGTGGDGAPDINFDLPDINFDWPDISDDPFIF